MVGPKLSGPLGDPNYWTPDYRGPEYGRTTVTDVSEDRSALVFRVTQSQKGRLAELVQSFETSVNIYLSTWHHIPEDLHRLAHRAYVQNTAPPCTSCLRTEHSTAALRLINIIGNRRSNTTTLLTCRGDGT